MNAKGKISSFSLLYGMFVMIVLNPATVYSTLCESRCENAVPYLRLLKDYWINIAKREASYDRTFTHFIQSLIHVAGKTGSGVLLKNELINMVLDYRDCLKACEHQHSKRSGPTPSYNEVYRLCSSPYECLFRQWIDFFSKTKTLVIIQQNMWKIIFLIKNAHWIVNGVHFFVELKKMKLRLSACIPLLICFLLVCVQIHNCCPWVNWMKKWESQCVSQCVWKWKKRFCRSWRFSIKVPFLPSYLKRWLFYLCQYL